MVPRVAPCPASFSDAARRIPGLPRVLALPASPPGVSARLPRLPHLPALPAMEPRVAPRLASFGDAAGDSAGCPASSLVSLASWRFHRVAPASAPSGCARGESPGRPESSSPLALPQLRPQVALSPAATAGSMMNPRLYSNFASSACAADESSRPIRSCTSLPDSGCSFNLILSARYRQAGHKLTSSNLLCIFLSGRDCVSKSLQGHQLFGE